MNITKAWVMQLPTIRSAVLRSRQADPPYARDGRTNRVDHAGCLEADNGLRGKREYGVKAVGPRWPGMRIEYTRATCWST